MLKRWIEMIAEMIAKRSPNRPPHPALCLTLVLAACLCLSLVSITGAALLLNQ
jgi:hypothetical protein